MSDVHTCVLFFKGVVGIFMLFLHMCAYVCACAFSWVEECVDNCIAFFFINLCVDRQGNSLLAYCVLHVVSCMLFFSFFSRIRDNYFGALANTGFGHVCE